MNVWKSKGVPANKLVMGIPFYGRSFVLNNPSNYLPGKMARSKKEGFSGPYTEEKKKREGKWQEPKLTPKQKEAMAIQLEKESLVRNRVKNNKAFLTPYLYILQASVKGKTKAFSSVIASDDFLPTLNKMLQVA